MAQLLVVDTVKIQDYIFGSNRLRENLGASYMVNEATTTWVLHHLTKVASTHNVANVKKHALDDTRRFEDGLDAECVYVGGGNALIIFRTSDLAYQFTRTYTGDILKKAPGLQVVVARREFNWQICDDQKQLAYEVKKLFVEDLPRRKRFWSPPTPLLGLGVTAMCQSTALPATGETEPKGDEETGYLASREIFAKLEKVEEADKRLRDFIQFESPYLYEFPHQLDHLGRGHGEHSYIAVVHADGDGVGKRLQTIGQGKNNRDYIMARRHFSQDLEKSSQQALQNTVQVLVDTLQVHGGDQIAHHNGYNDLLSELLLVDKDGQSVWYLPLRPIVFGGDDITFVCDSRIGLSFVIEYLSQFEHQTEAQKLEGGKLTASAGVAFVKSHYPFARAYQLAEQLAKSAKKYRHDKGIMDDGCLDWHFAQTGLLGHLSSLRERHYQVSDFQRQAESEQGGDNFLTLRPVSLNSAPKWDPHTWTVIHAGVRAFQDWERTEEGPQWTNRRNKIKALRDALRDGPEAVEKFCQIYRIPELPHIARGNRFINTGWYGKYCGYFDALELTDWFIPLKESRGYETNQTPSNVEK